MATRSVKDDVLDRDKRRVIRLQAKLVRECGFSLAGGTGLGLLRAEHARGLGKPEL